MKKPEKIILIITVFYVVWFVYCALFSNPELQDQITYKGFGWYGYQADHEIDNESIQRIKELGGNSVNINAYYEYDLGKKEFILLSNLSELENKIELAHKNNLSILFSPFVNLAGGHYLANQIKEPKTFLKKAKNVSLTLATFAEKNDVEIYSIWNELGLSLLEVPNSTHLTNIWLQETRKKVEGVFNGELTTKEGVQLGLYKNYNFSGFDYVGVTFYPMTDSCVVHFNARYCGVESLEEYEDIVKREYDNLIELRQRFGNKGIILGEIGIDVVGGEYIGKDNKSKKIRVKSYDIVLKHAGGKVDGAYFGKFGYDYGGTKLEKVFKKHFKPINRSFNFFKMINN